MSLVTPGTPSSPPPPVPLLGPTGHHLTLDVRGPCRPDAAERHPRGARGPRGPGRPMWPQRAERSRIAGAALQAGRTRRTLRASVALGAGRPLTAAGGEADP